MDLNAALGAFVDHPEFLHPLLDELRGTDLSPGLLEAFWSRVAVRGTPLLRDGKDGHVATFLYRLQASTDIEGVIVLWDGHEGYSTPDLHLRRLGDSDIWHGSVEVPADFQGMYYFALANADGIVPEDLHEPWPMSFGDPLNQCPTYEPDSLYARNVVDVRRRGGVGRHGQVSSFQVPTHSLTLPRQDQRPPMYPVWTYASDTVADDEAPRQVVLLMNGQFLECLDLAKRLDAAFDAGQLPPTVIVAPGQTDAGHTAWGWRNGFGPPELSAFLRDQLMPRLQKRMNVADDVHVVAWDYTATPALDTAREAGDLVRSVTLLCPSATRALLDQSHAFDRRDGFTLRGLNSVRLAVGVPTRREGPFAWTSPRVTALRDAARAGGLALIELPQPDPNIVSAADAMIAALERLLQNDSGSEPHAGERRTDHH
jgi:hypothetical protein